MTDLRATALNALCARAPWRTTSGDVTADQVRALYAAIAAGRPEPALDAGLVSGSDRRADRALQMLRRAGLIAYRGGRWVAL